MNKEEALRQFEYEKNLLEKHGHRSVITFDEWISIKNINIQD